ncbi:hypothetical protein [Streptomyces sp. AN091965]|uniref:hypothetical protein n=1 Tax=Streptomyces sp. AN091965 TaxID=2927803 RepID=UPI001F6219F2|nr:hypothetical protein [Streptomyces sp. AN091965]MCI3934525.1 hypothetical protein [Streptomyces sp. AN091965]
MGAVDESGTAQAADDLRATLREAARPHARGARVDSAWHNGGTGLALAATTAATVLPVGYSTWARVAAGVATFLIALLRALDFGSRWRWHLNMRARYTSLVDRVDRVAVLPPDQRAEALRQLYDDLSKIRAQERAIPGSASGIAASGSPP